MVMSGFGLGVCMGMVKKLINYLSILKSAIFFDFDVKSSDKFILFS